MKPLFIYNYEKGMQKKSKEFFTLFMKQGDQIEQEYTHDQAASKTIMTAFQDGKSDGPGGSNSGRVSSKFKQVK